MLREGGKMMIAVTATTADGLAARIADTATANVTMAATTGIATHTAVEIGP
jgi:hypothetical protein